MLLKKMTGHICPPITRTIPIEGFLRLPQVLRLIPVSRSCFLEMVKRGEFARPVKLTSRVTAWRVEDVRAFIASRLGNLTHDLHGQDPKMPGSGFLAEVK